jgi:hypothetical protein
MKHIIEELDDSTSIEESNVSSFRYDPASKCVYVRMQNNGEGFVKIAYT